MGGIVALGSMERVYSGTMFPTIDDLSKPIDTIKVDHRAEPLHYQMDGRTLLSLFAPYRDEISRRLDGGEGFIVFGYPVLVDPHMPPDIVVMVGQRLDCSGRYHVYPHGR